MLKDNNIVIVLKNIPNLSDTCVGSWQIISNNEILINCQGTTVYEDVLRKALYPSYDIHNDTIKVINKNKIIYKNAIYRKYKRNRN